MLRRSRRETRSHVFIRCSPRRRGGRLAQCLYSHALARERTIQRGIINDTFETAITWERFESFHDRVKAATERAIVEATGRPGQVTCRCTRAGAILHFP